MIRRGALPVLSLASLIALVAFGCDTFRPVAVEVNGRQVRQSSLDRELRALADNLPDVATTEGTLSSDVTAFWVSLLVEQEVIDRAVERRGLEVTAGDRDATRALIDAQLGGEVYRRLPRWMRDRVAGRFERRAALLRDLGAAPTRPTDEEVRAEYEERVARLKAACPSGRFVAHIVVETREKAEELATQLTLGNADFTELARTESTNRASAAVGGQLGCADDPEAFGPFAEVVASLPLNQVSAPVETNFGFHLVRVSDTIPFEAIEDQIREGLAQQSGVGSSPVLDALVAEADVEVDPRYGTWRVRDGQGQVQPPRRATATSAS
jgi:PPIC-type PPIASE domain